MDTNDMVIWSAKIAVLELKVQQTIEAQEEIKGKLDELLQLKSQGMGAVWLASIIFGTGVLGIVLAVFNWWKNG